VKKNEMGKKNHKRKTYWKKKFIKHVEKDIEK